MEASYIEQPPRAQTGGGKWGADTEGQTKDAQLDNSSVLSFLFLFGSPFSCRRRRESNGGWG